jgi:hypothetical protein
VSIRAEHPAPVLGIETETLLTIDVGDAPAPAPGEPGQAQEPSPPVILVSAGRVADLTRVSARTFTARYVLPTERFPQVAVIVAGHAERARWGMTTLRLAATTSPAFQTDPGARVSYRIGERDFGPAIAGADGLVRMPVVVPPGVTHGTARSVNQHGRAHEQLFPLDPPRFRRLVVAGPDSIRAGEFAEVAVFAVEASGTPADGTSIALSASHGRAQPLGAAPGVARFLVRAPRAATEGRLLLTGWLKGHKGTEVPISIPIVAGPPATVRVEPSVPALVIGSGEIARVRVAAADAFGNPTLAGTPAIYVNGRRMQAGTDDTGHTTIEIAAPAGPIGRASLSVEAIANGRLGLAEIPIVAPASPPPRPVVRPPVVGLRAGAAVGVLGAPGAMVGADLLLARADWRRGLRVGASAQWLRSGFEAAHDRGLSQTGADQLLVLALARVPVLLGRGWAVLAGAGAGVAGMRMDVRRAGFSSVGFGLGPAAEAALEFSARLPADLGPGDRAAAVVVGTRTLWTRPGTLSNGDRIVGNSAGVIVDLGYRLRL